MRFLTRFVKLRTKQKRLPISSELGPTFDGATRKFSPAFTLSIRAPHPCVGSHPPTPVNGF